MMPEKLMTIVIPSYNMEKYLSSCLQSLVMEVSDFSLVEVLVINDGSTDATHDVAKSFADRYPRSIRVIDKVNGHYGSCINRGLAEATGKYIKVLDADDSYVNENFRRWLQVVTGLEKSGETVDLLITDFVTVDETGHKTGYTGYCFPKDVTFDVTEDAYSGELYAMHSIAYRTELLRALCYRQTEGVSYTDVEWVAYPMQSVVKAYYWPHPVYRYLVGREGQSVDANVLERCADQSRKVHLALIDVYERIYGNGRITVGKSRYLKYIASLIQNRYYAAVFLDCGAKDDDLLLFDTNLRTRAPSIYNFMDGLVFSRRLPFRYIHAWRKKSWALKVLVPICKLYAAMATRRG